jgi:hypothetical protein
MFSLLRLILNLEILPIKNFKKKEMNKEVKEGEGEIEDNKKIS